jgi:glycosyltransferase involved in cell wall biosynthesis
VARLLPYENVDSIINAVLADDALRLVVVGEGPDWPRLTALIGGSDHVRLVGSVSDAELRWLYSNASGLVAASYEDYGLSPLEAATFGKPTAALHGGGYLDTIDVEVNGLFFDKPEPAGIRRGLRELVARSWDESAIVRHADLFSESRFVTRLREVVAEELTG